MRLVAPPGVLANWVEHFSVQTSQRHVDGGWRIVPDPCAHIIFRLESRDGATRTHLNLVGARSIYSDIDVSRRTVTIAARLRIGTVAALTHSDAAEFTDSWASPSRTSSAPPAAT